MTAHGAAARAGGELQTRNLKHTVYYRPRTLSGPPLAPGQQIAGPGQFAHRRPSQDSRGSGARAVASSPTLNSSPLPAPSWSPAAIRPSGTAIRRADSGTRLVGPSLRSGAGGATQQSGSARSSPLATRQRAQRRASDLSCPRTAFSCALAPGLQQPARGTESDSDTWGPASSVSCASGRSDSDGQHRALRLRLIDGAGCSRCHTGLSTLL